MSETLHCVYLLVSDFLYGFDIALLDISGHSFICVIYPVTMQILKWILAKLSRYKAVNVFKSRTKTQGCKINHKHIQVQSGKTDILFTLEFMTVESRYKKC